MDIKTVFLEEFGKAFIPKRIRPHLRGYLLKAGIIDVPYRLFGLFFYASLFITYILYFFFVFPKYVEGASALKVFLFTAFSWVVLPISILAVFGSIFYFYTDMRIFNRTKKMEGVLQDFLRMVSENLRGGMSFEQALWSSIRPEFGILGAEVRLAAKKVMTGQDVEEALIEFTSKYDSPMLRRSFDLIIEGLKGGGEIAYIIDRVVENIEETKELKAEMTATNLTYVIFVSFVVIAIAPVLFALSYHFLIILKSFSAKLGGSTTAVMPIKFGKITVNPDEFKNFSIYALTTISVFASMIVSIINKGSIKGGIKYIPFFVMGSLLLYFAFMLISGKMFSGFLGGFL